MNVVSRECALRAVGTFLRLHDTFDDDMAAEKARILREYKESRAHQQELLELLKPEIQRSLSYLHDYKQFVARIRQNINVVLEHRYPGLTLELQLAKALPSEKAIYWTTIVMEEKLQTAFLLLHPESIFGWGDTPFRLHGLVVKYLRIYASAFAEKGITPKLSGESHGDVRGDPAFASVIPHTLIDNALKYAPRGSDVTIAFEETADSIELRVSSYGPRIEEHEKKSIFEIFSRGKAAVQQEEEGAGFGLYLAQLVAQRMGTKITVDQTWHAKGYWTTFSVRFTRDR